MDLITGGSGLLGRHLALALTAEGHKVRLFDFRPPEMIPDGAEFMTGDIRDPMAVIEALQDAETVFHFAALMHVGKRDPKLVESVNIGGLENLMRQAEAAKGVKRIVFASSIEIYGVEPEDPCYESSPKNPPPGYPAHKFQGELMLREFSARTGIEAVFPRMPMILGPGFYHFKAVLVFFELLKMNLPIFLLDGGDKKGRMVAVSDVVQGLKLCAERQGINLEAFNLCGDDVFTHRGLIQGVIDRVGSKSRIVDVPSKHIRKAFDILYPLGIIPVAKEHFYFALHHCNYAIDKAKEVLGYSPRTDTVTAMIQTMDSYFAGGRTELRKQLANDLLARHKN